MLEAVQLSRALGQSCRALEKFKLDWDLKHIHAEHCKELQRVALEPLTAAQEHCQTRIYTENATVRALQVHGT